ncbi:MAG: molybdopterin-guanine dinucleotide biosynthesis protein MobB, partial [Helicobacter sp.]|nr:molybdopterin-guanine dinucleotide biosynthesis protein MobB [Helicobacter sp.]
MRIVAFSGDSNSGKTTLIEKLITHLRPHKTVAAIKHDPKDKAIIDTAGKDSDRFFKSGADIAIFGTAQTTLRFHHSFEISKTIQCFANY